MALDPNRFVLDCRGRILDCTPHATHGAHVMGVLNVTPDSFSDGGDYLYPDCALRRVETMATEGATLIDIGGASSRPRGSVYGAGAVLVPPETELQRVLPVVQAVTTRFPEVIISVDTYHADVAEAVLEAGAHLINDITGLRISTGVAEIAARFGAPLVVMHAVGDPGQMPHEVSHADVVGDVCDSLASSVQTARSAGVQHVIVDPGFGFGKTPRQNLELLDRIDALLSLDCPILIGVSRKSTIGWALGRRDVHKRLYGALGATAVAVLRGASIVRTHDVGATVDMLRVMGMTTTGRLALQEANS